MLTIGMAVDGNVLIYERMREEARAGKTPMASPTPGLKGACHHTDANITTLIAAQCSFTSKRAGTGFAVTLSIGIVASVFCNVIVTRTILQLFMGAERAGSWP